MNIFTNKKGQEKKGELGWGSFWFHMVIFKRLYVDDIYFASAFKNGRIFYTLGSLPRMVY